MHKRLIPLALAHVGEGEPIEGRTRLQKMVFVIQQKLIESGELREDQLYEFFPYNYGPFSKELAEDIDRMIDDGLLDEDDVEYDEEGNVKYLYTVENTGRELLQSEIGDETANQAVEMARRVKHRFNDQLTLPEVIDEVYEEYPEYAENSIY